MEFVLQVDFDQFKNALILVLSTTTAAPSSQETTCAPPQPGKEGVNVLDQQYSFLTHKPLLLFTRLPNPRHRPLDKAFAR